MYPNKCCLILLKIIKMLSFFISNHALTVHVVIANLTNLFCVVSHHFL